MPKNVMMNGIKLKKHHLIIGRKKTFRINEKR